MWEAAKDGANGPHVLIATSSGALETAMLVESTLAVALTLRGAQVHFLLCDAALPACLVAHSTRFRDNEQFVNDGPTKRLCASCYHSGRRVADPLGLPVHRYSDLITAREAERARQESDRVPFDEVGAYRWEGLEIGQHALAGALRYVTRGDFEGEPHAEGIVRRYLHGSIRTAHVTRRLLEKYPFEHACFHHGIYVPQGIIGEVAREAKVHVVNWAVGYRKQCFNFSHDESYHLTLLDEPCEIWEDMPWSAAMEAEIVDYLDSRAHGTRDWVQYHDRPNEDTAAIEEELGVDFSRPCVVLLTNILWDAQIHFEHQAFPGMLEWVLETIRYFADRPELQLIIRAHPGEVRGTLRSRQPIIAEIRTAFPELPSNVFLIPPESKISTYTVAEHCDSALIYGTKMGIELSAHGIPVIVAGEAWVRNKGLSLDAESREEYLSLLDRLPLGRRMDRDQVRRARKYAYHFFFRRMIPWRFMEPTGTTPPLRMAAQGLAPLMPGGDEGLDIVCDGIMNRREFLYPAEERHAAAVGTQLTV